MNRIALALSLLAVGASAAADEPTSVVATTYYRTFSHAHPVLKRIKPGEVVATKTLDSAGLDEKDVKRSEPFNPLTGPFFVEGAEPGDALVVRLEEGAAESRLGLVRLPARPLLADARDGRARLPERHPSRPRHQGARDASCPGTSTARRTPSGSGRRRARFIRWSSPRSRCSAASAWRRRAISRRPRGRRGPTAATSITTRSARGRPCTCRSITPAGCCSWATATPSRPTASRPGRGSRRRWTWSSSSS